MKTRQTMLWIGRLALLLILFFILFLVGSMAMAGVMPNTPSEPGILSGSAGFLLFGAVNMLLIVALISNSRWQGWKLIIGLALAYYGAVTVVTQIESYYFLFNISVKPEIITRLFVMGLPIPFIFIPLAVFILGKVKTKPNLPSSSSLKMPAKQLAFKLFIIAIAYVILYWSAGYFIAWQNPILRAFYGSPGSIVPFGEHTIHTLQSSPELLPFQIFRSMLWTLCAVPIILGSKTKMWTTAILLGCFFTVPQLSGLLLENPLMPSASVRLSHLIEGLASNFLFGMLIVSLLHRKHSSFRNFLKSPF